MGHKSLCAISGSATPLIIQLSADEGCSHRKVLTRSLSGWIMRILVSRPPCDPNRLPLIPLALLATSTPLALDTTKTTKETPQSNDVAGERVDIIDLKKSTMLPISPEFTFQVFFVPASTLEWASMAIF